MLTSDIDSIYVICVSHYKFNRVHTMTVLRKWKNGNCFILPRNTHTRAMLWFSLESVRYSALSVRKLNKFMYILRWVWYWRIYSILSKCEREKKMMYSKLNDASNEWLVVEHSHFFVWSVVYIACQATNWLHRFTFTALQF